MKTRVDFPDSNHRRLQASFSQPLQLLVAWTLDEVAAVIAATEAEARAGHWVAGFVAYEAAPAFDAALQVRASDGSLPLAVFAVYAEPDFIDAADAAEEAATIECGHWAMEIGADRVGAGIAAVRAAIAEGEYYQINYTTRLRADFADDGAAFFEALRQTQPAGYCAHFVHDDWQVLSVSPELFFDWRQGENGATLTTRPMKGTAPRHAEAAADVAAARDLHDSAKDRAENVMIVDLLRNDLARVAQTGSVQVPELFAVEALPTAWQMTSTVQCQTRPEIGLVDIFRALFPCGSVTGAPKVAAMQAIAALETSPRGAYCGAIGVIRPGGDATFNVGIRTVTLDARSGRAECGIGSGITWESSVAEEYAEWLVKRRFLLRASAGFKLVETLRLNDGAYDLLDRHLQRLEASAEHFGFALDGAHVALTLEQIRLMHRRGMWRVRLQVDCHGAIATECAAMDMTAESGILHVALAKAPVDSGDEFLRHKTTQRAVYALHAPGPECYDTLLWNERGEITEFTRGNVIVELDGHLVTPPLHCGLLAGTLRVEMLAHGGIAEQVVTLDDLARSQGLWFINSVRGMLAVALV